MNAQEIFDKVTTHLRDQAVGARSRAGGCYYLVPDTELMCAVGCLMSHEDARHIQDNNVGTVYGVLAKFPDILAKFDPNVEHMPLLRELQTAHDSNMPHTKGESLALWEDAMHTIAIRFGLNYTPPEVAA